MIKPVLIFTALIAVCLFESDVLAEESVPVLRVLNWSEYIALDQDLDDGRAIEERSFALREFAKEFNCKVEYFEYEATDEAVSRLDKTKGFYDVIVATAGEIDRMVSGNYLFPVNRKLVPNYRYISVFYDDFESQRELWNYAMPHLYGTTGIAYRTDLCPGEFDSLAQFFDPVHFPDQKRAIMNDSQVMFGLANIYQGNDPNENRRHHHNAASKVLLKMKSSNILDVISTNVELLGEKLVSGEIAMAVMYSGDALALAEVYDNIEYVIPKEGAEYYIDSLAISSASENKDLAHSFINFMLRPEVNARESMSLMYPTFNLAALSIVEAKAPEQLSNESIYPLPEAIRELFEFSMRSAYQIQYWNRFLNED